MPRKPDVAASRPGAEDAGGGKLVAPSASRNAAAVAQAMARLLADVSDGAVLEIGSGTGQHAVACAAALPRLTWLPSDPDPAHLASIVAWTAEASAPNLAPPLAMDATEPWPETPAPLRAVYSANVIHIAPWTVAVGIVAGAAARLSPSGKLLFYGPFYDHGEAGDGNRAFDASLRARDPAWGVRDIRDLAALASGHGFSFLRRLEMPANNLILVFER
ncbi:MAG: DUF938 domain-containing protein [Pseudomonadota bacterium]